ncbi:hypothetical protein L210DRAFT_3503225 [Boletus edulis BED1]|uniref:Uncharacterized protein n=1 Tax=Boletus edulis BED1 TaxID=1328754 RepID=A0AAD4BXD3_BOLED|nr:hypothetical protein L210DRAFT_3503225 [Boletus edulis BED1]
MYQHLQLVLQPAHLSYYESTESWESTHSSSTLGSTQSLGMYGFNDVDGLSQPETTILHHLASSSLGDFTEYKVLHKSKRLPDLSKGINSDPLLARVLLSLLKLKLKPSPPRVTSSRRVAQLEKQELQPRLARGHEPKRRTNPRRSRSHNQIAKTNATRLCIWEDQDDIPRSEWRARLTAIQLALASNEDSA